MALIMKVFFAPRKIAKIVIARAPDDCTSHEMVFAIISKERDAAIGRRRVTAVHHLAIC